MSFLSFKPVVPLIPPTLLAFFFIPFALFFAVTAPAVTPLPDPTAATPTASLASLYFLSVANSPIVSSVLL